MLFRQFGNFPMSSCGPTVLSCPQCSIRIVFQTRKRKKKDACGRFTVGPHEDIGKFPNCLNSIPSENFGLKKENEQLFFESIY